MALAKITYADKVKLEDQPSVADANKIKDSDMNEIKSVVNAIATQTDENTDSIDTLNERVSDLETIKTIIDIVYPVGSIYISYVSTNPGTLWPGTTWAREAEGRCIIGLGTGYPTVGAEGGSETVTLTTSQIPSHTHSGPSHTHTTPNHSHTWSGTTSSSGNHWHVNWMSPSASSGSWSPSKYGGQTVDVNNIDWGAVTGRTADAGAHTHTVSGTTSSNNGGNTGSSGTGNTGASGGGSSHTNMQPYVVMYIWRRTA